MQENKVKKNIYISKENYSKKIDAIANFQLKYWVIGFDDNNNGDLYSTLAVISTTPLYNSCI